MRKKLTYIRDWSELPVLMTLEQCAAVLNCTYENVRLLVKHGELPARKIGKSWRVNKEALKKMFEGGAA